jgi:hypothetical protein
MRRLPPTEVETLDARCRLTPSWWFQGLIEQQPANDEALNAEILEVGPPMNDPSRRQGRLFLAFDRASARAYLWSLTR